MAVTFRKCAGLALAFLLFVFLFVSTATADEQLAHATEGPASTNALSLHTQTTSYDYVSPDGVVGVYGITAGAKPVYDKKTKTIRLDGVVADLLGIKKSASVNVKLLGSNIIGEIADTFEYVPRNAADDSSMVVSHATGSIVLKGGGTLVGKVHIKGDLTVDNAVVKAAEIAEGEGYSCRNFTIKKGTFRASGASSVLTAKNRITIAGGTVVLKTKSGSAAICASYIQKGGICSLLPGGDDAGVATKSFTMSKGTLKVSGGGTGIHTEGNMLIKGGTIKISDSEQGIVVTNSKKASTKKLTIKGGKIVISQCESGISLEGSNMVMTAGSLSATKTLGAIECISTVSKKKRFGGVVKVSGGKLVLGLSDDNKTGDIVALSAKGKCSIKAGCLKAAKGNLPAGAHFTTGKNTYKVIDNRSVILTKFGANKSAVKLATVKFGGITYSIVGVGAKAFNTNAGKKVKRIVFSNMPEYLASFAFMGTRSLTQIQMLLPIELSYNHEEIVTGCTFMKGRTVGKKAFAQAGKDNGRGLTIVHLYDPGAERWGAYSDGRWTEDERSVLTLKKFLMKYGLPSGAVVKPVSEI